MRFAKPERPSLVEINAYPRVKRTNFGDTYPTGQRQHLGYTFRRVQRDGKAVAWNVFFRVGEPARHYYFLVHAHWNRVPGTHTSYGGASYSFHVKTR